MSLHPKVTLGLDGGMPPLACTSVVGGHHGDGKACPRRGVPVEPVSTGEGISSERALQVGKGNKVGLWAPGMLISHNRCPAPQGSTICLRTMEELVPTCGEGRVRRRPQEPLQSQTLSHPTGPLSFLLSPVLHQQGGDFSGFSLCVPCYYCPCRWWVNVPEEPCRASLGLLS